MASASIRSESCRLFFFFCYLTLSGLRADCLLLFKPDKRCTVHTHIFLTPQPTAGLERRSASPVVLLIDGLGVSQLLRRSQLPSFSRVSRLQSGSSMCFNYPTPAERFRLLFSFLQPASLPSAGFQTNNDSDFSALRVEETVVWAQSVVVVVVAQRVFLSVSEVSEGVV